MPSEFQDLGPIIPNQLYSLNSAALRMGLKPAKLKQIVAEGGFKYTRVGTTLMFYGQWIIDWAVGQSTDCEDDSRYRAPRGPGRPRKNAKKPNKDSEDNDSEDDDEGMGAAVPA